jgi:hypothetical protein
VPASRSGAINGGFILGLGIRCASIVLKTTEYFRYRRKRADRLRIRDEWIEAAAYHPIRESVQRDGRIRRWAYIDSEQRFLRVVLLPDGITVHNAFFDRGFPR